MNFGASIIAKEILFAWEITIINLHCFIMPQIDTLSERSEISHEPYSSNSGIPNFPGLICMLTVRSKLRTKLRTNIHRPLVKFCSPGWEEMPDHQNKSYMGTLQSSYKSSQWQNRRLYSQLMLFTWLPPLVKEGDIIAGITYSFI